MSLWRKARPVTEPRPSCDAAERFAKYSPFFLARMYRLALLRAGGPLPPLQQRLVDRALYSTYWDCVNADAREEAIDVIDSTRRDSC